MFQVIVRQYRGKVVQKHSFANEQEAWDFFDRFSEDYSCEFRDLRTLKAI